MIGDDCDPISGQPALKGGQVRANRFNVQWHAFAASTAPMFPNRAYSAVARTKTGWSCELAGTEPVPDWEAEARAVLNLTSGDASILQDAARGVTRVAIYYGTVLTGLYFSAPQPISIDRSHAIAQIKSAVPALTALAGLPMNDQPGQGRIVCACFNVCVGTIRDAIRQGAGTVMALGARTNAGTNCGSCKPELSELISDKKLRSPALRQEH